MVSQGLLIGIAVGIFFVGLGIGYAASQATTSSPMMMNSQQMQKMMQNPATMNQWMNTMMNDPQTMQQMHDMMMSNPQHMNQMMGPMMNTMMNDPQMQQQMMTHMMGNQEMMNSMMSNQDMMNMMNGSMMGSNMMMGSGMMGHMMGSPITQQSDVVATINNIEKILDQVSSNYKNGDQKTAFSLATDAYLENYEYVEGAIAQKDRPLMEKIELMMRVDLRNMIQNNESADVVDAKIASIKSELGKTKSLFQ